MTSGMVLTAITGIEHWACQELDLDVTQLTATHENLAIYLSVCKTLFEEQYSYEWEE